MNELENLTQNETGQKTGFSTPIVTTTNITNQQQPKIEPTTTNTNNETQAIDDAINELLKEYNEKNNEYEKRMRNRPEWMNISENGKVGGMFGNIANWFTGGKFNQAKKFYDEQTENIRNQRDQANQRINELKAKKTEYLTNIASQQNKYKYEMQGLNKVGINNPFYMLKNGVINGGGGPTISNIKGNIDTFSNRPWTNGKMQKDYLLEILEQIKKDNENRKMKILKLLKILS